MSIYDLFLKNKRNKSTISTYYPPISFSLPSSLALFVLQSRPLYPPISPTLQSKTGEIDMRREIAVVRGER